MSENITNNFVMPSLAFNIPQKNESILLIIILVHVSLFIILVPNLFFLLTGIALVIRLFYILSIKKRKIRKLVILTDDKVIELKDSRGNNLFLYSFNEVYIGRGDFNCLLITKAKDLKIIRLPTKSEISISILEEAKIHGIQIRKLYNDGTFCQVLWDDMLNP